MDRKRLSGYDTLASVEGEELIAATKVIGGVRKNVNIPVTILSDSVPRVITVNGRSGAVTLDKTDVGLSNVDNTSDVNKPISTATQTALNAKASASAVSSHIADTANPHGVTKAQVGLGNVDNTSDANKPVSTATQSALNGKASTVHTHVAADVTDFDAEVEANTEVAANTASRHSHANSAVLDATTASFTTAKDTKLSGIATGATANDTDANLKNRANHTGSQAISTVTGLQTALDTKLETVDVSDLTATGTPDDTKYLRGDNTWATPAGGGGGGGVTDHGDLTGLSDDDHPQYHNDARGDARYYTKTQSDTALAAKADASSLTSHTGNTSNPHSVTKSQVGLGNADNTSDANKPVSTAQQTALDTKVDKTSSASKVYATDGAGAQTTVGYSSTNSASTLVQRDASNRITVGTPTTGNHATTKTYVDGADALKQDLITATTSADYYRGDKTFATLNKAAVGLSNVDNTADTAKPVSTAQQTALDLKENLSNKSTTTTLGTSDTLYPSQKAVKTYVDSFAPHNGIVFNEAPAGTINGTNPTFTTAYPYIAGTLMVYVEGVRQKGGGVDYTETTPGSGVFTFSTPPATGYKVTTDYMRNIAAGSNDADTVDGYHASTFLDRIATGLIPANETWSYSAWNSTTRIATITVPTDATTKYTPGMRVKFTQSTPGVIWGIIQTVSSTSLGVFVQSGKTFANESISANYYAMAKNPFGFPSDPNNWKLEFTSTTDYSVAASSGTWYKADSSHQLVVPIGVWDIQYQVTPYEQAGAAATSIKIFSTLSTNGTSPTDDELTAAQYYYDATSNVKRHSTSFFRRKVITLASQTTFHLLVAMTGSATGTLDVRANSDPDTIIRAINAYL